MAKSIKDENGRISPSDFAAMYSDAQSRYKDFSRGVSIAHADDVGLTGIRRAFALSWDLFVRMPALKKGFDVACTARILFAYRDTPADVLNKLAYGPNNFR